MPVTINQDQPAAQWKGIYYVSGQGRLSGGCHWHWLFQSHSCGAAACGYKEGMHSRSLRGCLCVSCVSAHWQPGNLLCAAVGQLCTCIPSDSRGVSSVSLTDTC